jgi:putative pyruvate formate lyase activating enzyme
MPNAQVETREIMRFLAQEISKQTYVNVMDQYRPCGRAGDFPPIDRRPTHEEFQDAMNAAKDAGLTRLDERDWMRILRKLVT